MLYANNQGFGWASISQGIGSRGLKMNADQDADPGPNTVY